MVLGTYRVFGGMRNMMSKEAIEKRISHYKQLMDAADRREDCYGVQRYDALITELKQVLMG